MQSLTNIIICVSLGTEEELMTSYSSKEVIRLLEADGWELKNITGSHQQFKHPHKKGRVTVQHPYKDIPVKTLRRIEQQSGLKFR